ncbi:hypothetical protein ACS0TY_006797 [Phlomoides rotata]
MNVVTTLFDHEVLEVILLQKLREGVSPRVIAPFDDRSLLENEKISVARDNKRIWKRASQYRE